MIFNIIEGEHNHVGIASVKPVKGTDDFVVVFSLKEGFSLAEGEKAKLERHMKTVARSVVGG